MHRLFGLLDDDRSTIAIVPRHAARLPRHTSVLCCCGYSYGRSPAWSGRSLRDLKNGAQLPGIIQSVLDRAAVRLLRLWRVAGSTLSFREFLMLVALTSAKQKTCTWLHADQVHARVTNAKRACAAAHRRCCAMLGTHSGAPAVPHVR
jgi:hypothetical protein